MFRAVRVAFVLSSILIVPEATAALKAKLVIKAGPTSISPEEAALAASHAGEHAVVLADETIRTDITGIECEIEHHFRAKILTNEGRGLADVEIPAVRDGGSVKKWWGRVLLPDGTVRELAQTELARQTLVKSSSGRTESIRAALPSVVPGAVVDYGWVVRSEPSFYDRIELQRRYRVVSARYGWRPMDLLPAGFRVSRSEGRQVEIERDPGGVWVTARDLPAIVEEPEMPPLSEVQTAVHLYYGFPEDGRDDYWGGIAQRSETQVKQFNRPTVLREAIARMGIPAGAPLEEQLRAAYTWLEANVRRSDLRSSEEIELAGQDERDSAEKAKKVLAAGEGTSRDLDWLFIGVARELGASARLVYVADRRSNYFDPALRTLYQFAATVVAVGPPQAPLDKWTLADAGSGLPYGEVPWYFTGIAGLVATGKKAETLMISPAPPKRNVSSTTGTVKFVEGNEAMVASWTRTGTGQHGFAERRYLRDLDPAERRDRLRELCGDGGGNEVLVAEAPGLDRPQASLELKCEFEGDPGGLDDRVREYSYVVGGPWFEWLPDFSDERRVHPIIFRFPRTDFATVLFDAPEGFEAATPPDPVMVRGRFGDYTLAVEKAEAGFKVTRSFVLNTLIVPPAEYPEFRSFLEKVREADRSSIAFRRVEGTR